jgi:hypothetical protein
MGAVYQATDQRLGNAVALKHILVSDARTRKAFEREARLLAALRHPALPVVSDHFNEGTDQFIVMQFIPGDDLGTLLERKHKAFTSVEGLEQVLAWADQLLDVLEYLHGHTPPIIHRDIKPQNLKLTPRGDLVLLDFGLAKGSVNPKITSMTGLSLRAYTTQYAPLEQIQGTGTGPHSDVYSLASTLYHLLTGESPPSALSRAAAMLAGEPDPLQPASRLNEHITPALAAVIHQAMAPGVSKRFTSAAAMRTALRFVRHTPPKQAAATLSTSAGQQTIVVAAADASSPRLNDVLNMAKGSAVPAPAVEPPAPPAPPTLIVDASGETPFRTLGAALAQASAGSHILVRPGTYHEGCAIDKALEISGDGPREQIIIENSDAPVLDMQAENATVRGLTLCGRVGTRAAPAAVVTIGRGQPVFEECIIMSESRVCVTIHGNSANPHIQRCQIDGSTGVGVLVYGNGRGTLNECDISRHAQAGVMIRNGGNPTIQHCSIHHGEQVGIYVDAKGLGTLENCDIAHNVRAGIEIRRGGAPTVRHCSIHEQTQGYGVFLHEGGEGLIEECDIAQNARAGIAVAQQSNPLVRQCTIHHERQRGVLFSEQAQGTLEHSTLYQNGRVGVEIRQQSRPAIRQCSIKQHPLVAIWVHQQGGASVEQCDLRENKRGAWYIEDGCTVDRNDNQE